MQSEAGVLGNVLPTIAAVRNQGDVDRYENYLHFPPRENPAYYQCTRG